jgi:hypothetical protein
MNKEQFIRFYKSLPPRLQQAYFSEENVGVVNLLAKKNELSEEEKIQIFHFIYDIILGLIPIEQAQNTFEQEIESRFPQIKAKKIYFQIYRNIFSPIKEALVSLYKIEPNYLDALEEDE